MAPEGKGGGTASAPGGSSGDASPRPALLPLPALLVLLRAAGAVLLVLL